MAIQSGNYGNSMAGKGKGKGKKGVEIVIEIGKKPKGGKKNASKSK